MQSSSRVYYLGLDHVRALAALLVVSWHFLHGAHGAPVPFGTAPAVPGLALFDEGHTGVALFMTLSGYLFARLLENRRVDYWRFLGNRVLRLAPLLLLVMAVVGLQHWWAGQSMADYGWSLLRGFWRPDWPNGGWSVTVELHFYLLLPLLLVLERSSRLSLLALVGAAVLLRLWLWWQLGSVQIPAYFTLVGRIDQFVLGMLLAYWRERLHGRHALAFVVAGLFCLFYYWFDASGGFYHMPSIPSSSMLWVWLPLIEGLCYSLLIAWYDTSFTHSQRGFSGLLARIGSLSYSVYLLHFFVVFHAAQWINAHIMPIHNFYAALPWAVLFYLLMLLPAWLSYRWIETPFLRLRKRYARPSEAAEPASATA